MKLPAWGMEYEQIVGIADDSSWSQVRWEWDHARGIGLSVVLGLKGEGEEKLKERGRLVMEWFMDEWQKAPDQWIAWIKDTIVGAGELLSEEDELIVAVWIRGEEKRLLYVGGKGAGEVKMVRDSREFVIWKERLGGVVSGWLRDGDLIKVGTKVFIETLADRGMKDVDEFKTEVAGLVNGAFVAGFVVDVEKEEVDQGDNLGISELVAEEKESPSVGMEDELEANSRDVPIADLRRKRWWLRVKSKLRPTPGVKLRSGNKQRLGMFLGLIFLGIFAFSVVVGASKQREKVVREEYLEVAEPIQFTLDEAIELAEINPIRARNLVQEAQNSVEAQGDRFVEGKMSGEWEKLQKEVERVWLLVSGEVEVKGDKWVDLSVFKEGIGVTKMTLVEDMVAVWGENVKALLTVELESKAGEVVAGSDVGDVVDVGGNEGEVVVLTNNEVVRVNLADKAVSQRVDTEGVRGKVVEGFAGNAYVINNDDLWKFSRDVEGIGRRNRYLGAGVEINLGGMVDMAIDGDIWILYEDGGVYRLSQGRRTDYVFEGYEDWGRPVGIMASEEKEQVYVWDKELGKVLVFSRESGDYLRTLVWDSFREAEDMVLDEKGERLIVGIGGELWEVKL